MRTTSHRLLILAALPLATSFAFVACSSSEEAPASSSTSASATTSVGTGGAGGGEGTGGSGGEGGMKPDPTLVCPSLGLPARPWTEGPYGVHRGEIADGFVLDLVDGTTFDLKERYSGCESYVFLPDKIPVSDADPTSVWEKNLDDLIDASPKNTHYFFITRQTSDDLATEATTGMQGRIDALVASLSAEDAEHWKARLHVVKPMAKDIENWTGDVIGGHGRIGFGIDREQKIRGVGYLSDVSLYSSSLEQQGAWPWKSNLAYLAHEPQYWEAQYAMTERLAADSATVVDLWGGETLAEFAETDITLPDAATMATFDTLEVEIEMMCPDPDAIEPGNCGAWDYLAYLFVRDENDQEVQLARFITSYHRETHWVVDVSPMLVHLLKGGSQHFKWSFAPSWNTQPTATRVKLRLSNKAKGMRPTQATPLWTGGAFGSTYNDLKVPVDVPIPAEAKKVELWAIITGHGAATNYCAEFCNHQHEFSIGASTYLKEHEEAGTEDLCVPQLAHGMVPNQPGTWWFGRGGWCPGQQVDPWVVDVTADVTPGTTATVSYQGLFNDQLPPDGSGDIDMTSYLIVWE